jgi:hypothetical protein
MLILVSETLTNHVVRQLGCHGISVSMVPPSESDSDRIARIPMRVWIELFWIIDEI